MSENNYTQKEMTSKIMLDLEKIFAKLDEKKQEFENLKI